MPTFLREIAVIEGSLLGGVGIPPTFELSIARNRFKASGGTINIPPGIYGLIGHDDEVALLQPIRGVHPRWLRWFWVTDIRTLIPRPRIYSKALPLVVSDQEYRSPYVHHDAPSLEGKLWRYMSFSKFEKLLEQRGIFLARADTFTDTKEGTLSPANQVLRAAMYRDDPLMASVHEHLTGEIKRMKHWTYVSCWRADEAESWQAWQEYGLEANGVAIQTEYLRLKQFLSYYFCTSVRYVNFDNTWIFEGNTLYPFMHKDRGVFAWEKEFRIIEQKFPRKKVEFDQSDFFDCSLENPSFGRIIPMDLRIVICKIVIAPRATPEFREQVRQLSASHGFENRLINSTCIPPEN